MADTELPPLDRGDESAEDLMIGVLDSLGRIIPTVNVLIAAVRDLQSRGADPQGGDSTEAPASIPPGEWVAWLRVAYKIESSIIPGWESIPGTAQELLALHAAWCAAYQPNGAPRPGHAAASWHDALARALPRIRTFNAAVDKRGGSAEIPPLPAPADISAED